MLTYDGYSIVVRDKFILPSSAQSSSPFAVVTETGSKITFPPSCNENNTAVRGPLRDTCAEPPNIRRLASSKLKFMAFAYLRCWNANVVRNIGCTIALMKYCLKYHVFGEVTPRGSCKNRRFGGTYFFSVLRSLVTANVVSMQNGVFWDVMPCGSCKSFGGT
jgi:hypothetical protein